MELEFKFFHLNILKCSDAGIYTGYTADLVDRLDRHQRGSVHSTNNRRPVELIFYASFPDKYKAMDFERYLKSGSGRAFLNKRFI